jgi:hypothetical protein
MNSSKSPPPHKKVKKKGPRQIPKRNKSLSEPAETLYHQIRYVHYSGRLLTCGIRHELVGFLTRLTSIPLIIRLRAFRPYHQIDKAFKSLNLLIKGLFAIHRQQINEIRSDMILKPSHRGSFFSSSAVAPYTQDQYPLTAAGPSRIYTVFRFTEQG